LKVVLLMGGVHSLLAISLMRKVPCQKLCVHNPTGDYGRTLR